ncbi:coenzyme PQQ precursor peptide PqqA [Pollutimonas bauzanensis]|uniref:Coenzyme PQQ synthesis protein A n=1 Tax=Pollutimonas bauzanensis TaxID=658167 RepID=A0A1M5YZP0_9BURK|nr:coenzyme PQQ precursor peptide PqqA [Pollutimonas bauzanensis]
MNSTLAPAQHNNNNHQAAGGLAKSDPSFQGDTMKWSKPEFSDLRFGFEITMYIANR